MSHPLRDIYDREFFRDYSATNPAYVRACRFIGAELARRFAPDTAVDWGCGAGFHAAGLLDAGVNVVGVDGVRVDDDQRAPGVEVRLADLTAPVPGDLVPERYDLSVCIDVMEHIDDGHSRAVLRNITRGASLVILSCAPPFQGGHHHINERPRRYWIARMAELDWRYDRRATGAMENYFRQHRDVVPLSWMYHNLCVYRPAE
jgi:hypothetical protein